MATNTIQTTYYAPSGEVVKINHAKHDRSAVLRAVDHMQMNDYKAAVAEVYDVETTELHSIITHNASGLISILFKRDPKNPTCLMTE